MSEYSELQGFLKGKGYIPLDWPRDDYKPGLIRRKEGWFDKKKNIVFVAGTCFPRLLPQTANLSDIELSKKCSGNWSVDLDLAVGKILETVGLNLGLVPEDVKVEFGRSVDKKATLSIHNVTSEYIEEGFLRPAIKQLEPGSPCYNGIMECGPCLVIQESLKTDKLQYTFNQKGEGGLDVVINWFGEQKLKPVKHAGTSSFSLIFDRPYYFAFAPIGAKIGGGGIKTFALVAPPIVTEKLSPEGILGEKLYLEC